MLGTGYWKGFGYSVMGNWYWIIGGVGNIENVVVHPPSNLYWRHRVIMQTGISLRHRLHHLSLLPSGPDEVRDRLLRGDRSKWSKLSN